MAQYDVIIVGAGPAGMTAAIYAARADMNVLLLDKLARADRLSIRMKFRTIRGRNDQRSRACVSDV